MALCQYRTVVDEGNVGNANWLPFWSTKSIFSRIISREHASIYDVYLADG